MSNPDSENQPVANEQEIGRTVPLQSSGPPGEQQAAQQVQIDDSKALASYANFCRVTGTPEELIVDFGLSKNPMGPPGEKIEITQRLIMNFYTAKRLLGVLQMAIQRHEQTFGVLETDIQRRVRPEAFREMRR
jgi:hypothetical protein